MLDDRESARGENGFLWFEASCRNARVKELVLENIKLVNRRTRKWVCRLLNPVVIPISLLHELKYSCAIRFAAVPLSLYFIPPFRRIGWMSGKWESRRVRHFPFPREFNSRDTRERNFVSCEFATLMEFRRQSRCLGRRLLVLPLILHPSCIPTTRSYIVPLLLFASHEQTFYSRSI